jgi:Fe2+ transport system protein FeoA
MYWLGFTSFPFRTRVTLMALSELKIGRSAIVEGLRLPDEVQHHLMHMGFIPDARVRAVRRAPAGDPTVYAVDGMEVALRQETARWISVRESEEAG